MPLKKPPSSLTWILGSLKIYIYFSTKAQKETAHTQCNKPCAAYQVVEDLGRRPCAIAAGYELLQNPSDALDVAFDFFL